MSAVAAFGWSQKGHDTVAYIAEKHLSEPLTRAYRVWSLPMPTLRPGWCTVPRWRLMMLPALANWPGHDTVAYIAEKHLSEAAADSVASLLDGKSPVYWANWLDNASHTPDYAYTKTWHCGRCS